MKRILVVDDDPDMLVLVQSILKQESYETELVLEWHKIYTKVREFQPDLIILDVYLGGIDGRIICQNLKTQEETRDIPIIMCSAYLTSGDSVKGYNADSFITKPLVVDTLMSEVKQCIAR